jgi:hypothetical protein
MLTLGHVDVEISEGPRKASSCRSRHFPRLKPGRSASSGYIVKSPNFLSAALAVVDSSWRVARFLFTGLTRRFHGRNISVRNVEQTSLLVERNS